MRSVLSFEPPERGGSAGGFIGPGHRHRATRANRAPDPDSLGNLPAQSEGRRQSRRFPLLSRTQSPGGSFQPAVSARKVNFLLKTRENTKPTLGRTSPPEVSKGEISQASLRELFRVLSRNPGGPRLAAGRKDQPWARPQRLGNQSTGRWRASWPIGGEIYKMVPPPVILPPHEAGSQSAAS